MATEAAVKGLRAMLPALAAALLLGACATPAPPPTSLPDLPAQWGAGEAGAAIGERWWTRYRDPRLDRLVDEALGANLDLQLAAARVLQARAVAGIAEADRYPGVSASASSQRSRSSLEGSFPLPQGTPRIQTTHRVGVEASYEVDLWGRYASAAEAARADLLATDWARRAVELSLIAEVVDRYHLLRAADRREATLHRTLAVRDDALEILTHRMTAGTASEFDLDQARAEIASLRAQLALTRQQREDLETALGVLLGRTPKALFEERPERGETGADDSLLVPPGLPSELLLRRPDLRQAEMALAAADARVAAARADLFPSITLTASLGQESTSLSRLFDSGAGVFGLGLQLLQPVWNAGRLHDRLDATRAQREQAELSYRKAIIDAFGDVRRALAAQHAAADQLAAQNSRSEILREALRRARLRFEAGITGGLEVLDAERNLLQAELAAIDAQAAQQVAIADLVRALGGGWTAPPQER